MNGDVEPVLVISSVKLVDLASRATASLIVGGDDSGVSLRHLRCRPAWVMGRSSLPSLFAGSASTAISHLGGGGGRGGEGPMFLPRSIADLPRIGSMEDPDLPLLCGAFFPAVWRPEADCERVTACVPHPRPLIAEDALRPYL